MKQYRRYSFNFIRLVFMLCIFGFILTTGNTSDGATTIKELEDQMDKNADAIEKAQSEILSNDSALSIRESEIYAAEEEIAKLSKVIREVEINILAKEEEIDLTLVKLEETKAEQEEYYNHTKDRIKVMYEYGSTEYLEVLLESSDASDFFSRLEYLNKLVSYDQSMLDNIERIKTDILDYEQSLLVEKIELDKIKDDNNANLNNIEAISNRKKEEIAKIQADQELLRAQIEEEEKQQIALDEKIQELIKLYSDNALLFGEGKVNWPVPGWSRISSAFGPRYHPVYGYKSVHTGIDIPASYGTSIVAAATGKVIFAGWGKAYGNYILIDHGKDKQGRHIITQYGHCSSLLVVEGAMVARGVEIAKVGSTGWSTGNHLHFGVQIGGVWVDPMSKTDK